MEVHIRGDGLLVEDQANFHKGCKKRHGLEVTVEPIGDEGIDPKSFLANGEDVPEIPLDATNNKIIAPMENFTGSVRFNRISNRRAWCCGCCVKRSNILRSMGIKYQLREVPRNRPR